MNDKSKQEYIFDRAVNSLGFAKLSILHKLPLHIKNMAQEIRLKTNGPVIIACPDQLYFILESGQAIKIPQLGMISTSKKDVENIFASLCEFSIHSYEQEINNGYITVKGGHRAGICGTAVVENNEIKHVRDISSINLRIARQIYGCADGIIEAVRSELGGLIIAGPPACGKTTILRDTARQLASGALGKIYNVAVADERGELSAVYRGSPQNDMGYACDCLDGYPKHIAIDHAVRCLSPRIIICDEIGSEEQVDAVSQGFNSGVTFIVSVHASNKSELEKRPVVKKLLDTGAFNKIIMLSSRDRPGKITDIYKAGDFVENCRNISCNSILSYDGCTAG